MNAFKTAFLYFFFVIASSGFAEARYTIDNSIVYQDKKWMDFTGENYSVCNYNMNKLWDNDFTISLWFKAEKTSDNCPTLISQGTIYPGEWMLRLDNGVFQFYADDGKLKLASKIKDECFDNNIHYGVIVKEGNKHSLYLDGKKCDSKQISHLTLKSFPEVLIGSAGKESKRWWKGLIGNLVFYQKAIDEKTISDIYAQEYYRYKNMLSKKNLLELKQKFSRISKYPSIYIKNSQTAYNGIRQKLSALSKMHEKHLSMDDLNSIWNKSLSLEKEIDLLENKFVTWDKLKVTEAVLKDNAFFIYTADSLNKISNIRTWEGEANDSLQFEMARNEYENMQIIITPSTEKSMILNISCSDLINDKQDMIAKENIKIYNVEYVNKSFPDPLRPVSQKIKINPKDCVHKTLWISLYTPNETKPGVYSGNISLKSQENHSVEKNIPIKVKVRNFSIPVKRNLPIETNMRLNKLTLFYHGISGSKRPEKYVSKQYYIDALKYLMNYRLIPKPSALNGMGEIYMVPFIGKNWNAENQTLDFTVFDKLAQMYINNGSCLIFSGQLGGHFSKPKRKQELSALGWEPFYPSMKDYLPKIYKHLKDKEWIDKAYFYAWDEPRGKGWTKAQKEIETASALAPGVKQLLTYYFVKRTEKTARESITKIIKSVPRTCIWCCLYSSFSDSEDHKAFYRKISREGEMIWLYDSNGKSFNIRSKSIEHRAIFWNIRKYKLKGFLIWGSVDWRTLKISDTGSEISYELYNQSSNGDGFLLYPAGRSLYDGLMPSIRLELMRDGIEDWEYFHLLDEKTKCIEKYKSNQTAQKLILESRQLLDIQKENIDTHFVLKNRKMIAEQIEKIDEFIETLPNKI
jgi:hypothetical protein